MTPERPGRALGDVGYSLSTSDRREKPTLRPVKDVEVLITAVICTRNRAHQIAAAVSSVLENHDRRFELLVIDQSDGADTATALQQFETDGRLRYFHSKTPGLSAAYNTASREGIGEIFAFTDDDCIVPPEWLTNVRQAFDRDPDVELVYGQVRAPAYSTSAGDVIPELRFPARRRLSAREGFSVVGMGANFAARRHTLRRLHGFDEVLGGGGPLRSSQDFDFQFRLFRAAGVSLLCPSLEVEHHGLRTAEQWPQTLSAYGIGDGAFYMKHVRCGDRVAARLLATQLLRETARTVLKPIITRRRHSPAYLVGLMTGVVRSYKFGVDRERRLYVSR